MEPVTKTASQIVSAAAIPSTVRNAFAFVEEERPGAAHIELPVDYSENGPVLLHEIPRESAALDLSGNLM